ncbi:aldo/keto reductase [Paraburkholderia sabiae]|jgi:D-threo-aldose 1-dehydrogenase|uniref:Aldo/keto reductase n=1 Tax=Paraburkholderia sabiae TaxID=273251 RepID=A0ABU9Q6M1_9BURK|nr:aldo/keto reductase [Paraburkholderia sabiae]WJZ78018.1 aldo/keto reductase [Paraburkholderia sabiae]CAD6529944.1 D-threo-aldose 1-dehydrogenase [Paraburkholderia sabiae]
MRIDLPSRIGFGTAPLGNMYRDIPHDEAIATVQAAWDSGIRYFDAAPLYGAGLAELRLGEALEAFPRDQYLIGTKVGRLILDEHESTAQRDLGEKGGLFEHGLPNRIVYDYTESGTLRSIEESLERLRTDRLDYVWIHDPAVDFHGEQWRDVFDIAMSGAAKALTRLRDEGVIKAWGLGVNRVEPCVLALEQADPDGFLLAGRYTLLDHTAALEKLMPAAAERGLGIIVGGPYNSGLLAGGTHYEYQKAPQTMIDRVAQIKAICERFGVDIRAVALQFSLAHPAVAGVIPGASRPERIAENRALAAQPLPAELWRELKSAGVISQHAPTPAV